MKKRKVKLIISDIDGTLVIPARNSIPSKGVIEAVVKLKQAKILLCLATARSLPLVTDIIDILQLQDYIILDAGARIYYIGKKRVLWQRTIPKKSVRQILGLLSKTNHQFVSWHDNLRYPNTKNLPPGVANIIFCFGLLEKDVHELKSDLNKIPNIHISESTSWDGKEYTDLVISHAQATKQYAIFELLKMLKIDRKYVLGIGDKENDLPLLSACGIKVAMGNADKQLKEIADWVAPPVWEDGFAVAMKKFAL